MKKIENTFAVTGFVGQDAEIRSFATASVARFSLAVSRQEKSGDQTNRVSSFMNFEAWRKNENTESFDCLTKGTLGNDILPSGQKRPSGRFFYAHCGPLRAVPFILYPCRSRRPLIFLCKVKPGGNRQGAATFVVNNHQLAGSSILLKHKCNRHGLSASSLPCSLLSGLCPAHKIKSRRTR